MQKKDSSNILLIDAHVHIHDCFDIDELLNSALRNFQNAAQKYFNAKSFTCVLMLTESYGVDYFTYLKEDRLKNNQNSEWSFHLTQENNSIIAEKNKMDKLVIISGRQIVTKEKLEVLGLGIMNGIGDKNLLKDTIRAVVDRGGLAVIPWGVGKWIGLKKRIVKKLVNENNTSVLFLGDNGNRPFFWLKSKILKDAENKKINNLSGSDPLPFKTENNRAGSFGFAAEGFINFDEPFKSIFNMIVNEKAELIMFGKLETPFRFFRNQILMQVKKKLRRN